MPGLSLPQPTSAEQELSEQLAMLICDETNSEGGGIGLDRYIAMALYQPGLGYYAAGQQKFGRHGDFITAPELTPLFGHAVANQAAEILTQLDSGVVIEFGAGSGKLALDVITRLEQLDRLPQQYYIVEVSAELRARQQQLITEKAPSQAARFTWLDALPDTMLDAVVIANEVLDAMPVTRFRVEEDSILEQRVTCAARQLALGWSPCAADLERLLRERLPALPSGYESEINLYLRPWVDSVSAILRRGCVLLVDYGYVRRDYFHPDRNRGTLMCHYRHQAHSDVLLWPGLQDITAHVDFTAVAEAAVAAGLDVAGFTTQANFLVGCGIDELLTLQASPGDDDWFQQAEAVKRLMLPTEMGEVFKVIALTRGVEQALQGFSARNMLASL